MSSNNNNKKYNFSGKVAVVTGSSSGIGAAIAIQLAQYGARLTITGQDGASLDKVAQQIVQVSNGVKPLQLIGNLRDDRLFPQKLINETVNNFGRLDILVNNVGYSEIGTLSSPKLLEEFDEAVQLNVRIPVELTQLAVATFLRYEFNLSTLLFIIECIARSFPVLNDGLVIVRSRFQSSPSEKNRFELTYS